MSTTTFYEQRVHPLDDAEILKLAPSVFTDTPAPDVSAKYHYISTKNALDAMRAEGLIPVRATQSRSLDVERRPYAKHMLTFRRIQDVERVDVGEIITELHLVNSHDRGTAWKIDLGFWRKVCGNGLHRYAGGVEQVRVRHIGADTPELVEGAFTVLESLPKTLEQIERWRDTQVTREQFEGFAKAAAEIRWDKPPVAIDRLMQPRRRDDQPGTAWLDFNILQEHLLKGGDFYWITNDQGMPIRKAHTREVKSIDEKLRINQALWSLTDRFSFLLN
jgi:hypothetical protein